MSNKLAFYMRPFPQVDTYYKFIDCAVEYSLHAVEGFCHMELTEPDVEAAKKIRQYADEMGITFCCFSVYANIVGEDAEAQVERMKGFADVAAILGSPFFHHTIAPHFCPWEHTEEEAEEAFQLGIKGVREIYDHAAKKGVRAIYEDQAFIFNGVAGFTRFLQAIDRNIGIVADFGNIYQVDERIEPFIEKFMDKVVHVHLKDMTLVDKSYPDCYPTLRGDWVAEMEFGSGSVDFEGAIALLKKYGYDGYYGLEYGAKTDGCPSIQRMLDKVNGWLNT